MAYGLNNYITEKNYNYVVSHHTECVKLSKENPCMMCTYLSDPMYGNQRCNLSLEHVDDYETCPKFKLSIAWRRALQALRPLPKLNCPYRLRNGLCGRWDDLCDMLYVGGPENPGPCQRFLDEQELELDDDYE